MISAPKPANELERLQALHRYDVLDTDEEQAYDDLVELASSICQTPMAMISLVDADRQWFKARKGVTARQTPRDVAFCAHAILEDDVFVVNDARTDHRFSDNPLVTTDPGVRFYAGAQLETSDGHNLGALCVADRVAHEITEEQKNALRVLARQAVAQLELRRNLKCLKEDKIANEIAATAALDREMETRLLHRATTIAAEASSFEDALQQCLDLFCEKFGWTLGHAYIVNENDPNELVPTGIWHAPNDQQHIEFQIETNRTQFRSGVGLPGRVLESGEPAWIPNIRKDTNFPRQARVANFSLTVGFAFPLKIAGVCVAVLEFFSEEEMQQDERVLQIIKSLGEQLGRVLERKRAEHAVSVSEERVRQIIDTALDSVISMSADGKITNWNKQAEKTFGWSREEVLGRPLSEIIVPEKYRKAHQEGLKKYIATGEGPVLNKRIEITALHRNGHEFPVELAILPTVIDGAFSFCAFIRDITELKRTEKELKDYAAAISAANTTLENRVEERTSEIRLINEGLQHEISERRKAEAELHNAKEAAEAASKAKSEFLANMSHEIRTPMNGIIGMTQLTLETDLSPEQREYLKIVKESSEALLSIINDILDFSKIEAGKLELNPVAFSLRDCISDTVKAQALLAHDKGLELICHTNADAPDLLYGDPGRLRQIVVNLVGNAIKFTERGEVVVEVQKEWQSKNEVCLHFSVRDTGIGIAEQQRKSIFEAFVQADGSITRKYGGTGLGLTITTRLVELMNGRMWLESELDQGSTFHFTARFDVRNEAIPQPPALDKGILTDLPVLIVDDNATNRIVLRQILLGWKMKPVAVESGAVALDYLRSAKRDTSGFALVLLDAMMPEMDGFTLAERIKLDPELGGATIMMLSSAGQPGDAARCRELGMVAYLTKPIKQSELLESILLALGHQDPPAEKSALITRHTIRESHQRLRILLAEDNAVNQKLATRILEKNNHFVTVAGNGREALRAMDAVTDQPFDVIFMDVQMPIMGGFETTEAIREREKATATHVPIIAMTANVMKGDRERCLQAGMDDYICKPLDSKTLLDVLSRWTQAPAAPTAEPDSVSIELVQETQPLDMKRALLCVDNDTDLLSEVLRTFCDTLPDLLAELESAGAARDLSRIRMVAHSLKGAASNICAEPTRQVAEKLEALSRAGKIQDMDKLLQSLLQEVDQLKSYIEVHSCL